MKYFLILSLITLSVITTQAQEHGFIGGLSMTGFNKQETNASTIRNYQTYDNYDNNLFIGYQYRQLFSPKYLIDFYGLMGSRTNTLRNNIQGHYLNSEGEWIPFPRDTTTYSLKFLYFSAGIIGSYKIWKQLHVGIGVEPTCYYSAKYPVNKISHFIFDIPLIARLGYSFKYFDVSAAYKKGSHSLVTDENFRQLKVNDLQFSFFIPITNFFPKK